MADKTGQHVIYYDPLSIPRDALVTADWNKEGKGPINLVIVSTDTASQDSYGRQITRQTSVAHITSGYEEIMGNCWCTLEEYNQTYKNKIPKRP